MTETSEERTVVPAATNDVADETVASRRPIIPAPATAMRVACVLV